MFTSRVSGCFGTRELNVLLTCALACWATAAAARPSVDCPDRIETAQSLKSAVSPWQTFEDPNTVNYLSMVDYYDGEPKGMAQLVPDNEDSLHDPVWTFSGDREIWQVCRYTNTQVSLTKKLPKGIKKCSVKYSKEKPPEVASIVCK
ncbi:MAG TPA: STY0301 family protein [Bdellovibrionota bacterium]|jgi:hypothetical protein|nr:STY0301 family protein [Bdellovibrionota bacterium]